MVPSTFLAHALTRRPEATNVDNKTSLDIDIILFI